MKNLITRTITGIVFVLVIVGAILYSTWTYAALFAVITLLTLAEFYRLFRSENSPRRSRIVDIAAGAYLFGALFVIAQGNWNVSISILLTPYILYLLYTYIHQLYAKRKDPITNWAYSFLGQLYVVVPLSMLSFIAYDTPQNGNEYNPYLLLAFFVFIWINDSGAYIVGSLFGKHRLFERISPKKSWEGFFGGMLFCLVSGYVFSLFFSFLSIYQWLGFSLVVCVFSTFGDLSESLLKRTINIKDSGNLLPGHGGMLDRFDSVLLAAPASVIYLSYLA